MKALTKGILHGARIARRCQCPRRSSSEFGVRWTTEGGKPGLFQVSANQPKGHGIPIVLAFVGFHTGDNDNDQAEYDQCENEEKADNDES